MRPFAILTTALLCISLSACTIRKQDEIECGLPDGSSFILRAKYDWSPFARFIPHAAERINRTGLNTYYRPKGRGTEIGPIGGGHHPNNYNDIEIARQLCSPFGLINKAPYVVFTSYKPQNSTTFAYVKIDKELFLDPSHGGNQPPHILETLEKLNANIGAGAYIWRSDRLVLENRVVSRESPYINLAVYRIESFDDGQTWSNPHITTEPEAFELGKTYEEQCFVARLIRIDKQKIEAHFPTCPVSEALPD